MNFSALLSNLKSNPIPAIGGLLVSLGAGIGYMFPQYLGLAALLGTIGGAFLTFAKQSTTTGGITPNAVAAQDTLPSALITKSTTIVPPTK